MSATIGASFHGLAFTSGQFSRPRSKFPQDGKGSATPKPRMPRFASAIMKMGIEVQNCAESTGRRLGNTCRKIKRCGWQPSAFACSTKSDSRMARAPEQITRPEDDQPSTPSNAKVTTTDVKGATFNGSKARIVSSRNNHGNDSDKSVAAKATRSNHPPR